MAGFSSSSAARFLQLELKKIKGEPVEGFRVLLPDDSNLFLWDVAIFGPPDTLYQGGYFKNGEVCISILHPPTDDPLSGELPSERWNPTQNVRTILLSIISLLNEPNTSSPANVDASVSFRNWKEGKNKEYESRVRKQVLSTKLDAEKDGVKVPTTISEYCISSKLASGENDCLTELDFYDEDCVEDYEDDEDDEDESEYQQHNNEEDSGNNSDS